MADRCPHGNAPDCRICQLIDPSSPHYREEYRRLYVPEDFPDAPAPPPPFTLPGPDHSPQVASIPLAGDLVAAMTKRIGVDRLTRWVAEELGVDCHCSARQEALNRLDAKFRRFLGW